MHYIGNCLKTSKIDVISHPESGVGGRGIKSEILEVSGGDVKAFRTNDFKRGGEVIQGALQSGVYAGAGLRLLEGLHGLPGLHLLLP